MNNINASYISPVARRRAKRWFIPRIIIIGGGATIAQFYLPWWSLIISAFLLAFFTAPLNRSPFWAGFIGLFLSWGVLAFIIDIENNSILSSRVVKLFPIPESSILLILVTGIIGGIIGGFSSASGDAFRRIWMRE